MSQTQIHGYDGKYLIQRGSPLPPPPPPPASKQLRLCSCVRPTEPDWTRIQSGE